MKSLPPDAEEVRYLLENVLPRCPLCGQRPNVLAYQNPETTYYRSVVHCSRCECSVGVTETTRELARAEAVRQWGVRTPLAELLHAARPLRHVMVPPDTTPLDMVLAPISVGDLLRLHAAIDRLQKQQLAEEN